MFRLLVEFVLVWFIIGVVAIAMICALFALFDWRFHRKVIRAQSVDRGGHVNVLDEGVNIGIRYDSSIDSTNDYQTFVESFDSFGLRTDGSTFQFHHCQHDSKINPVNWRHLFLLCKSGVVLKKP